MTKISPDTTFFKFTNLDSVDLSALNCDDFVQWLRAKSFSEEHCQAFKGMYMHVCMHVCIYASMHVCMYICM